MNARSKRDDTAGWDAPSLKLCFAQVPHGLDDFIGAGAIVFSDSLERCSLTGDVNDE